MTEVKFEVGTIRYQGLFDFEGLYQAAVDWCKAHRYHFHEDSYKHKVPSPLGAEQEMLWTMYANVTEFFRFDITINVHTWEMTEVEVIKDGKKKILTNARLEIKMKGKVTADWQGRFKEGALRKMMKTLLTDYIWRREFTSVYADTLYYRLINLNTIFKKYLDMQTAWNEYEGYLRESK